jgi:hypothetical protein
MFMNGGIVGFEQNPESKLWVSIEMPDKIELKRVLLIGKDKIGKRIGDNLTLFFFFLSGFSVQRRSLKQKRRWLWRLTWVVTLGPGLGGGGVFFKSKHVC